MPGRKPKGTTPARLSVKERCLLKKTILAPPHPGAAELQARWAARGFPMHGGTLRHYRADVLKEAGISVPVGRPRKTPGIVVKGAVAAEVDGAAMTAAIGIFRGRAAEVCEAVRTFFAEAGLAGGVTRL